MQSDLLGSRYGMWGRAGFRSLLCALAIGAFAPVAAAAPILTAYTVAYGDPIKLVIKLPAASTGTVTFSRAGETVCADVPVQAGAGTCPVPQLAVGSYTFTAVYSGDATYGPSTAEVTVEVTQGKLKDFAVQVLASAKGLTHLQSTILSASGLPDPSSGTVTFIDGGATLCTAPIEHAEAHCPTTALPTGSSTVRAQFGGDDNYEPTFATAPVNVAKAAASVTLSVKRVDAPGHRRVYAFSAADLPADATGVIAFVAEGATRTTLCAQLISSSAAECEAVLGHSGTIPLRAEYAGDANYLTALSGVSTLDLTKSPTSVEILAPAASGASVARNARSVFAAYVSSDDADVGPLDGTVTFSVGSRAVCAAPAVNGFATCIGRVQRAGAIGADYGGNANASHSSAHRGRIAVTAVQAKPHVPTLASPVVPKPTPPAVVPKGTTEAKYRSSDHPKHGIATIAAAFALLSIVGAGAAAGQGHAVKVASAKVKHHKGRWAGRSFGDDSWTWRLGGWTWLDRFSRWAPVKIAPPVPLGARLITDGNYLRAMLGTASLALPLGGLVGGLWAGLANGGSALPPSLGVLLALTVLGAFDAAAGFVAAIAYALTVIVQGALVDAASVRILLGTCVLWFAVALIGGAARPFRRPVDDESAHRLARLGDFVVITLLAAWASQKIVGAFPNLAEVPVPDSRHANTVALVVLGAIAARFALETACVYLYPERLSAVTPEKIPWSSPRQRIDSLMVRTAMFVFIALAFVPMGWELWVGAVLFSVPQILRIYEREFPNSEPLYKVLPGGILKTVVMMYVGFWFFEVFRGHVSSSHILSYGFVALALPATVVGLLEVFGRDGPDRDETLKHLLAGLGLVILGVLFVLGQLP